jgi:hypothetical protein
MSTNESDRELLELAAKAAGIDGHYSERIGEDWGRYSGRVGIAVRGQCWNPLTDDGDAFRLAVKLGMGMDVLLKSKKTMACIFNQTTQTEAHSDDPCAATRRAIVRAAAAIGK